MCVHSTIPQALRSLAFVGLQITFSFCLFCRKPAPNQQNMLATRQIGSSTVCRRSCSSTAFSHAAHQRNRTTGCCERRSSSPLHTTSQQVLLAPCSQSQLSQQQQHQQQQQQALACRATINSESAANQEWALQMSPAAADELERDRQCE